MDNKDLKALMEAYSGIYAPQQLDELSDRKLRAYIKKSDKSHKEINKKWDQGTATEKEKLKSIGHEIGQRRALKKLNKEELDLFDLVLEFLQSEGVAESLEEAQWMMANLLNKEEIAIIVEAMHEDEDEEDEKEMKKEKKSKKEKDEEDEEDEEEDDEEDIKEASYSAKAARAGKDIGKPGKAFAKIAKSAAKRYGSEERGKKVAGAVLAKLRAKG